MQLTEQQKEQMKKEGIIPSLVSRIEAVEKHHDTLEDKLALRNLAEKINGVDGANGRDGRDGRHGTDGKDGAPGPQGEQGERGEKGENGKDGKDGKNGKDGVDGKNGLDGSPDTADTIRNKLELLPDGEKLAIEAIQDLRKELEELRSETKRIEALPRGTAPRASNSTKFYPLTADGVTKTFTVPKSVAAILHSSDFPNVLYENSGFTINGTRTQITITTDNAPSSGSQLLYQYSSMFN